MAAPDRLEGQEVLQEMDIETCVVPDRPPPGDTHSPESCASKDNEEENAAMKTQKKKAEATMNSFKSPEVWMCLFGDVLAFNAGVVNVVAFKSVGTFVSHVSGVVSTAAMHIEGIRVGDSEPYHLGQVAVQLACFIFGAFLCGLVIPKGQVHFGGKAFYGTALLGESVLLTVTTLLAFDHAATATYTAAMACGLQNAMCTMHFGAIVRTTHVTGTATDIGSTAGRAFMILLRRGFRCSRLGVLERAELHVDNLKLRVLVPIFVCFFLGSYAGAWLFQHLQHTAFVIPAILTGFLGLVYTFLRGMLKRYIKAYALKRLNSEVKQVDLLVQQATSAIRRIRSIKKGDGREVTDEAVSELEEEMEQIHHAMEDVEAGLEDLSRATSKANM